MTVADLLVFHMNLKASFSSNPKSGLESDIAERLTIFVRAICREPVQLEECKVDDLSEPVHELCYAKKLKEEIKKRKSKLDRWRV